MARSPEPEAQFLKSGTSVLPATGPEKIRGRSRHPQFDRFAAKL